MVSAAAAVVQFGNVFSGSDDHPSIEYRTRAANDRVSELNRRLRAGSVRLRFETGRGYLRSVLDALEIPVESQMAVFSKTSRLASLIHPGNPRTIYFNDAVVVGWVRGSRTLEVAAQDPRQGAIFYILNQQAAEVPQFQRVDNCLECHESYATVGVPGMLLRSVYPGPNGLPKRELGEFVNDHRSPMTERWGGWYVTGKIAAAGDMGRHVKELDPGFDTLTPHSDVVALMVFGHQMRMMNLLTRVGWEARFAEYEKKPMEEAAVRELVDYMLFVDEAPVGGKIEGGSGFAEKFTAAGPKDSHGRSLRQFDLERRMMRYPCSYMIDSAAFEGLPGVAKEAVYKRMWEILSGAEQNARYARLSPADRRAVVEILRATKSLPWDAKAVN
jgi:hypothetical protein